MASNIAALKTFKCVVKNITPAKAVDVISSAFSRLGRFLSNPDPRVRESVIQLLNTICEFNHDVMMSERVIKEDFQVFFGMMRGEDHKLTQGLCEMFSTLVSSATQEKYYIIWRQIASEMTPLALELMTRVTSDCAGDCMVIDGASGLLINLVLKAYSTTMLEVLIQKLLEYLTLVKDFPKDRLETLLNGIFLTMGMCIHTAKRRRDPLNHQLLIRIYQESTKVVRSLGVLAMEFIYLGRMVATSRQTAELQVQTNSSMHLLWSTCLCWRSV